MLGNYSPTFLGPLHDLKYKIIFENCLVALLLSTSLDVNATGDVLLFICYYNQNEVNCYLNTEHSSILLGCSLTKGI